MNQNDGLTRLDRALSRPAVRYSLYGLLILLAILILRTLNSHPVLVDDAQYYYRYGLEMASGDYTSFVNTIRTYGYPLFIALCIRFAWLFHLADLDVITAVQFLLHVAAAWVASRLARALLGVRYRPWIALLVFAVVVLNPYLLAMTTQILTDSITVLCITSFMLLLHITYAKRSFRLCLLCGMMFGVCYVIRPFHLMWGIGLLGGGLLLYGPFLNSLPAFRRRFAIRQTLYIALSALAMIASQFIFTWVVQMPYNGTLTTAFYTIMDNSAVLTHRLGAVYYYRYETYGSPEALAGGPTDRTIQYYSRTLRYEPANPLHFVLPVIKTISLFQQHDYPTYRPSAGLTSPSAFAVGLVLWSMYCYVLGHALWDVWRAFRTRHFAPIQSFMVYAISLYILLYAVPTIPEPRYIDPIYALLTVLACVYAAQETRWWPMLLSIVLGIATYLLTAHLLLEYVLVGYPLFSQFMP